jgi:hypothetical protein
MKKIFLFSLLVACGLRADPPVTMNAVYMDVNQSIYGVNDIMLGDPTGLCGNPNGFVTLWYTNSDTHVTGRCDLYADSTGMLTLGLMGPQFVVGGKNPNVDSISFHNLTSLNDNAGLNNLQLGNGANVVTADAHGNLTAGTVAMPRNVIFLQASVTISGNTTGDLTSWDIPSDWQEYAVTCITSSSPTTPPSSCGVSPGSVSLHTAASGGGQQVVDSTSILPAPTWGVVFLGPSTSPMAYDVTNSSPSKLYLYEDAGSNASGTPYDAILNINIQVIRLR